MILPGSTIGILGNGQLGRMTALAAKAMGYFVAIDPYDPQSPTGQVADHPISQADVLTFEFENVSAFPVTVPVRPSFEVLHITQNRLREKTWLRDNGLPVTPFQAVTTDADLEFPYPAILKTAGFGYDGKGQTRVASAVEARAAWTGEPAVLEKLVEFRREISVIAARGVDGNFAHFGVMENAHRNHVLDVTHTAPELPQAIEIAREVLEKLNVIGVLCVEFFETHDGELLVNELAPRPHNSGHLTIEACATSQFEQQVRAVCGLPLGDTTLLRPAAMANLLGDVWANGEPDWAAALADARVKLHLYGKLEPRPGRKMGHLTALADTAQEAAAAVRGARERLTRPTKAIDSTRSRSWTSTVL